MLSILGQNTQITKAEL